MPLNDTINGKQEGKQVLHKSIKMNFQKFKKFFLI